MRKRSASYSVLGGSDFPGARPAGLFFGQAYFGTVSGELTDATGAVVEGASIVLTDQQKGFCSTRLPTTVGAICSARFRRESTRLRRKPRVSTRSSAAGLKSTSMRT